MKISYECSELIEELEEDIIKFGENEEVIVWCKNIEGTTIYTNYDFDTDMKIHSSEVEKDEYLIKIPMKDLLTKLREQNKIL